MDDGDASLAFLRRFDQALTLKVLRVVLFSGNDPHVPECIADEVRIYAADFERSVFVFSTFDSDDEAHVAIVEAAIDAPITLNGVTSGNAESQESYKTFGVFP